MQNPKRPVSVYLQPLHIVHTLRFLLNKTPTATPTFNVSYYCFHRRSRPSGAVLPASQEGVIWLSRHHGDTEEEEATPGQVERGIILLLLNKPQERWGEGVGVFEVGSVTGSKSKCCGAWFLYPAVVSSQDIISVYLMQTPCRNITGKTSSGNFPFPAAVRHETRNVSSVLLHHKP